MDRRAFLGSAAATLALAGLRDDCGARSTAPHRLPAAGRWSRPTG